MNRQMTNTETTFLEDHFTIDAYPNWKQYILRASESVKIYTPYADDLLNNLISIAKSDKRIDISIITKVDGDSLFETGVQFQALKRAIQNGCRIYHLDNLHAKLLVVDNRIVSAGSQNFTYRGRKNKEITVISETVWKNTNYIAILSKWEDESVEINESFLDSLIKIQDDFKEDIEFTCILHHVTHIRWKITTVCNNSPEISNKDLQVLVNRHYRIHFHLHIMV